MTHLRFSRAFTRAAAAIGLAAGMAGFAATPATAAETIKIGSFLSVTGPASFLGDPEKKTLELYIEKINKDGGVLGKKLELIVYDVQHKAGDAVTAVKRLIGDDKVDFIVGGSTTGTTMAVIPLVEKAEIPFISLAGAIVIVKPVKKWVFKTPHTDRMACGKVFADMKKRGIARIGLISGTGGFGKSMRKQCLELAKESKIEVVADETYGPKDADMTTQLTKIKGAAGLQAVLNPGFGAGPAIVTKNFQQLGLKVPLYQSHGVASKKYIELAGEAANGVRLPAAALLIANQLDDKDPQKAPGLAYIKAYEAKYKEPVSTFGGHAYDALFLLVEAIKKAGTTDRAKVRDALEATKGFVGIDGIFNMSAEDHLGLDLGSFKMIEISKGDWKFLY